MKKEHLKFMIPVVIVLIISAVFQQRHTRQRGMENFRIFYNAEISGRIQSEVSSHKGTAGFTINGQSYTFYPHISEQNNNSNFQRVAQPGDSIFKGHRQDTLFLIQDETTLWYTFYKFDE